MFKFFNATGRDSQRQRLYKAERRAQQRFPDPGADVSTPDKYRAKLDEMMRSDWMRANYPKAAARPVTVKFNPRMGGAHAGSHGITTGTGPWVMNMLILCHELGHTITRREHKTYRVLGDDRSEYEYGAQAMARGCVQWFVHQIAGHGPEYAAIYLQLVRQFIGYEQWRILREEFDASRIRYNNPFEDALGAIRMRPTFAAPSKPRNSNPSVSASVRVTGGHLDRPTIYSSVRVAFAALQLPMNQHQKFRKDLKLNGTNQIGAFTFTTITK